jgi:hypothetical protein
MYLARKCGSRSRITPGDIVVVAFDSTVAIYRPAPGRKQREVNDLARKVRNSFGGY